MADDTMYNVDLRCHTCSAEFSVENVRFDQLGALPLGAVCVKCSAAGDVSTVARLHQIVSIRQI